MKNVKIAALNNKLKPRLILELSVILLMSIAVYILSNIYDLLERIYTFSRQHENLEIDELITVFIFLVIALTFFSIRRWRAEKHANHLLTDANRDLRKAMSEIKQLKGFIPICASCKKIRNDEGYWQSVEAYIRNHSDAEFTHSICPECRKILYPELYADQINDKRI